MMISTKDYSVHSSALFIVVLTSALIASVQSKDCPGLTPPSRGLLRCERTNGRLQCLATCYNGLTFDTKEEIVVRNCDDVTGLWREGNSLPVCEDRCKRHLLTSLFSSSSTLYVTASTDTLANDVRPLKDRALLGNEFKLTWRPEEDDLKQYIQVELPTHMLINGVVLRGDGKSDYVTSFRVLFSQDGVTWYPYGDGSSMDKFFPGNYDSVHEVTRVFKCPQLARYVRINPVTWEGHVTLAFDLIGCYNKEAPRKCRPVHPPTNGVVNCEVDDDQMLCTGYCVNDQVFQGNGTVISTSCTETSGVFDIPEFPPCVDDKLPRPTDKNTTMFCLDHDLDCSSLGNGDYQYCGDCHYFATCSHGYLYVRACPALLQFDLVNGLCDYKSHTCNTKTRRTWLAERRLQTYREHH